MFSKNLIQLRKKYNYSQEQLAEMTGVTRQAVSKWESGMSTPDIEKIILLADIFDMSIDELLRGCNKGHKESADFDIYTILSFIGLCIIWITGAVMRISYLFSEYAAEYTIFLSWLFMLTPVIIFVRMLKKHNRQNQK